MTEQVTEAMVAIANYAMHNGLGPLKNDVLEFDVPGDQPHGLSTQSAVLHSP